MSSLIFPVFFIRKMTHVLTGMVFMGFLLKFPEAGLFLGTATFLLFLLDLVRQFIPKWKLIFNKILSPMLKDQELRGQPTGATILWLSIFIVWLIFPENIFITSCMIAVVADPVAAMFGKLTRGKIFYKSASIPGSLAFFTCTAFIILFFLTITVWKVLLTSLIITLIELTAHRTSENFVISISSAFILYFVR
jgi:dolichol kinase